ncbi:hypothetical protein [Streptomyces sp. NPDC058657]|uniref:hypothetical protein n=1 Tax=unclassified Streptomyces TaxID=2593676 RepID=UPI003647A568
MPSSIDASGGQDLVRKSEPRLCRSGDNRMRGLRILDSPGVTRCLTTTVRLGYGHLVGAHACLMQVPANCGPTRSLPHSTKWSAAAP